MNIHAKVKKPPKDRTKNNDSDIHSQTAMGSRFEHIHKGGKHDLSQQQLEVTGTCMLSHVHACKNSAC